MDQEYEWELVEDHKNEDIISTLPGQRKILRNSIIAHMIPAYPGIFDSASSTLQLKVFDAIPAQGITCAALSQILNLKHSVTHTILSSLVEKQKVFSIRVNGAKTRYYKMGGNIAEVLMLPYSPGID